MQVFKFGGASVNSAEAVRNMARIVKEYGSRPLVVVVSAMGKTTNALERLVPGTIADAAERQQVFDGVRRYHEQIIDGLFLPLGEGKVAERMAFEARRKAMEKVSLYFELLGMRMEQQPKGYSYDYDQTVSLGELISTTIVSEYLNYEGQSNRWMDVRELIRTDANYREGHVDWETTLLKVQAQRPLLESQLTITQGFIAGTANHTTTTLGREGSDYSAAILSHCLGAESMTIWKDVPGFLNADPKYFADTVKIDRLPYNEAIEQAYYGASVIHPKTVKPLQNKGIPLHIKSFVTPQEEGSVIGPFKAIEPQTPLYIVRHNQVLLSVLPKDFSFIAEDNLQTIFSALASTGVRVNLMQNSALSFSLCVDSNPILLNQLQELLSPAFRLRYNEGLQLITIRYYTQDIIDTIVAGRPILLQQRSRTTAQTVVG